ncbi:flagellar hook-basal body complex protein FliE [Buttiauxella warmboldiae]|uniref:Flagellar hook-basal body complex protein FliE n=1 Tax=Buttiauxella warmboldiae TaxID=82993 RepID=A0A3N5DLU6_9ENTR|nr:flagellar hook-basal body complex protein FliE [Buttiauxella warmboldiae]RPH26540.1 flagellar hook-basal body complex protein FliE [Buttiauxella warmboldiae]
MSIQLMKGILQQLSFQAQQTAAPQKSTFLSDNKSDDKSLHFSSMLFNSINSISQTQNVAQTNAQDYMTGATDIGLNDVMVSMQKSSVALNLGIQVRNKMVNAYQEIMNMAV